MKAIELYKIMEDGFSSGTLNHSDEVLINISSSYGTGGVFTAEKAECTEKGIEIETDNFN